MDLRQIQYFLCLFEEQNVTRAAHRLNVVQSALSMQLAKLEKEFGQKLFERTASGMVPTPAGRQMYKLFLPIMRDISNAQQSMAGLAGQIYGQLDIGVLSSIGNSVLAPTVAAFVEECPQVEITAKEAYSGELIDDVLSGKLDCAIVNRPPGHFTLPSLPVLEEELCVISRASMNLSLDRPVRLDSLGGLKLVLLGPHNSLRNLIDAHAKEAAIDLVPHLSLDGLTSIVDLVEQSDWVTVLPQVSVYRTLQRNTLVAHPIEFPRMTRVLQWIHHHRRPLTPAAKRFIELMNNLLVDAVQPAWRSGNGTTFQAK